MANGSEDSMYSTAKFVSLHQAKYARLFLSVLCYTTYAKTEIFNFSWKMSNYLQMMQKTFERCPKKMTTRPRHLLLVTVSVMDCSIEKSLQDSISSKLG